MLVISGLTVSYGGAVRALSDASINVPDRGVLAVLGSNGAGKTTLLRSISGTLARHRGRIEAGAISFGGASLVGRDAADIVRAGVVCVPEGRRVFGRMSVEDNLRAGAASVRDRAALSRARSRVDELFPILAERRGQRAALLSGGEQQMLAMGRALMSNPKLLLLDEPSLGLAPMMIERIGEIVAEIHRQGTSVVLVEQNATMALSVADAAVVLELGRVSLAGPAAELAATDEVQRLYLGHGSGGDGSGGDVTGAKAGEMAGAGTGGGGGTRTLPRWEP